MISWIPSRYGETEIALISTGLKATVFRDGVATRGGPPIPYSVRVAEATLTKKFDDKGEAKAAAIRLAKRIVQQAASILESE